MHFHVRDTLYAAGLVKLANNVICDSHVATDLPRLRQADAGGPTRIIAVLQTRPACTCATLDIAFCLGTPAFIEHYLFPSPSPLFGGLRETRSAAVIYHPIYGEQNCDPRAEDVRDVLGTRVHFARKPRDRFSRGGSCKRRPPHRESFRFRYIYRRRMFLKYKKRNLSRSIPTTFC